MTIIMKAKNDDKSVEKNKIKNIMNIHRIHI